MSWKRPPSIAPSLSAYQHEASRRIAEAFAANKRRALLVMVTGTGKNRVAMALIEFFSAPIRRRTFFSSQIVTPMSIRPLQMALRPTCRTSHATASTRIDKTKRLFVATEQTLALCYTKLSRRFFDLIIFDEAHSSLFNRFTKVIEYPDARMIGLTANPATFIDRDIFRLFGCDANVPTFLYD